MILAFFVLLIKHTKLGFLALFIFNLFLFSLGIEILVDHLYKHKIPIAIATSSSKDGFKLKTKNHRELINKFHHVVCGSSDEEVEHGKPAPDIFLVCKNRFDNPPPSEKVILQKKKHLLQKITYHLKINRWQHIQSSHG